MAKETAPKSSQGEVNPHQLDSEDPSKHAALEEYYANFDRDYARIKADKREEYFKHLVNRIDAETGEGLTEAEISEQLRKFDKRFDKMYGRNNGNYASNNGESEIPEQVSNLDSGQSIDNQAVEPTSNIDPKSTESEVDLSVSPIQPRTELSLSPKRPELSMVSDDKKQELPPAPERPKSPPASQENLNMTAAYVDLSEDVERHAHYLAQKRWEDEMHNTGGFFRRVGKKLMGDYQKNRYFREFREAIVERETLKVGYNHGTGDYQTDTAAADRFAGEIIEKYVDAYADEIEQSAGEYREVMSRDSDAYQFANSMVQQFVVSGNIDQFQNSIPQLQKIINQFNAENGHQTATGNLNINNLLEVAQNARNMVAHGQNMAEVMARFELALGESRSTARTQEHYNAIDNATRRWDELKQRIPGLMVVPDELIAGAASIGIWVATSATNVVGRTTGLFGGAAVIGAVSGLKEGYKITRQRALYGIDTAYGQEYGLENRRERRDRMGEFLEERTTADALTHQLADATAELTRLRGTGNLTRDALNNYMDFLAQTVAQKEFSAEQGVDKITYSSLENVQTERRALAMAQQNARQTIREILVDDNIDLYNFDRDELTQLKARIDAHKAAYAEDLTVKNCAFTRYKRLEQLKTGLAAGGASLIIGTTMQEALAYINPNSTGALENLTSGPIQDNINARNTFLGGIFNSNVRIDTISPDTSLIESAPGQPLSENDQAVLDRLRSEGFSIEDHSIFEDRTEYANLQQTLQEYMTNNPSEFQALRTDYFNNNTPDMYDLNEQGGRLEHLANGNIRFGSNMTADGSFVGGETMDMTQQANTVFTIEVGGESGVQKVFHWGEEIGPPWNQMLYEQRPGVWAVRGDSIGHWGIIDGNGGLNTAASIPGDGSEVLLEVTTENTVYDQVNRFFVADKRVPVDVETEVPFAFGWWHRKDLGSTSDDEQETGSGQGIVPVSSPDQTSGRGGVGYNSSKASTVDGTGSQDQLKNDTDRKEVEKTIRQVNAELARRFDENKAGLLDIIGPNLNKGGLVDHIKSRVLGDDRYVLNGFAVARIGYLLENGIKDFTSEAGLRRLFGTEQSLPTNTEPIVQGGVAQRNVSTGPTPEAIQPAGTISGASETAVNNKTTIMGGTVPQRGYPKQG